MSSQLEVALNAIPSGLRDPLIEEYTELLHHYQAQRWESVGLKAGKLCEIVYTILHGLLSGAYQSSPSKPQNMVQACGLLEQFSATTGSRAVRIQIPRILIAVYELRNNRAIGHVSGIVNPNHMDAEFFLRSVKWIIAELVRDYSSSDVQQASLVVESVTQRIIPAVWQIGEEVRVLKPGLDVSDKVLVLLYVASTGLSSKALIQSVGYANPSRFRNQLLKDLHSSALIHYDRETGLVTLSPLGARHVEDRGLLEA